MRTMPLLSLLAISWLTQAEEVAPLMRHDFEIAAEIKGWDATHDTEKTFAGSKGALKAKPLVKNTWFGGQIVFDGKGATPFKITDQTMFHFCYFTSEAGTIKVVLGVDDATIKYIACPIEKPKVGEWTVASVKLTDFKDKQGYGQKAAPGLGVKGGMTIYFGKPDSAQPHWLDNVVITEGPMPGDLDTFVREGAEAARAKAERLAAEKAAQSLTVEANQALLSVEIVAVLKRGWKKDSVAAGTIMTVGADAAKALDFWTPLTKTEFKASKVLDKYDSTLAGGNIDKIAERAKPAMSKHKPEVVAILPGIADLALNKTPSDIAVVVTELADAVFEAGAIPVIYTPAIPNRGLPTAVQAYKDLADEMRKLAIRKKYPLVDAFAILNPDGVARQTWFSGLAPNSAGHEAINKASCLVYKRLEEYVFERREKDLPGLPKAAKHENKTGTVADEE